MSKAVLISIRPEWCEKIASGEKTIEVRKMRAKLTEPFKCYIYCTKSGAATHPKRYVWKRRDDGFGYYWNGNVIGEFVCDNILELRKRGADDNFDYCYLPLNVFGNDDIEPYINCIKHSCIEKTDLNAYGTTANRLYGWHISNLKIYDKPKELSEFEGLQKTRFGYAPYKITRPPQSWCYVEELA